MYYAHSTGQPFEGPTPPPLSPKQLQDLTVFFVSRTGWEEVDQHFLTRDREQSKPKPTATPTSLVPSNLFSFSDVK